MLAANSRAIGRNKRRWTASHMATAVAESAVSQRSTALPSPRSPRGCSRTSTAARHLRALVPGLRAEWRRGVCPESSGND